MKNGGINKGPLEYISIFQEINEPLQWRRSKSLAKGALLIARGTINS